MLVWNGNYSPFQKIFSIISFILSLVCTLNFAYTAIAGPYAPAHDEADTNAIYFKDDAFSNWANGYQDYLPGKYVDDQWKTPKNALGAAEGTAFDVVVLGQGGQITMTFDPPIRDGVGWDFAVFENSFNTTFLELAWVEVSSNGQDFVRFPNVSLTSSPVSAYGSVDPTDITGLAGKYIQGYGVPFNLSQLADTTLVLENKVDLSSIAYVKIVDIPGDGLYYDSFEHPIYDPYFSYGSAGFDLDGIGVRHSLPETIPGQPLQNPEFVSPQNMEINISETDTLNINMDKNTEREPVLGKWSVALDSDFLQPVFKILSADDLEQFQISQFLLNSQTSYFWKADIKDNYGYWSNCTQAFQFETAVTTEDLNDNGIVDSVELDPVNQSSLDLNQDDIADIDQISASFKSLNIKGQENACTLISNNCTISRIDSHVFSNSNAYFKQWTLGQLNIKFICDDDRTSVSPKIYSSDKIKKTTIFVFTRKFGWVQWDKQTIFSDDYFSPQIKDGSFGDLDGITNNIIVCSLAFETGQSQEITPDSGSAGIGGGCIFSPQADNDLWFAVILLIIPILVKIFYSINYQNRER